MKNLKLLLLGFVEFLTIWWYVEDASRALRYTTFILGETYAIYDAVGMYQVLKSFRFRIRYVPKRNWMYFISTQLIVWALFYLILSEPLFMAAYIIEIGLLFILLVYDIISTFLKRLFR